jgi:hypothetical protein
MRMQLMSGKSIRNTVTAITATLLGSGTGAAIHAQSGKVESSLLLYSETDRVKAAEGVLSYTKQLQGDRTLGVQLTLDGLTGASPNGATPSTLAQTFTRPSGNGGYVVQPGEIPLDKTFKDTRYAADVSFSEPLDRLTRWTVGGHLSAEHDYSSFGVNTGLTRDFNRRNTTVGISGSFSHDLVSPLGGAPDPFSEMQPSTNSGEEGGIEDGEREGQGGTGGGKGKNVFDAVFSVTQILDRKTILRLNLSLNRTTGYLSDPYKLLSVVANQGTADAGEPVAYIYEKRPGARNQKAVFAELRRYIAGSTVDLSYRYFWDSWGIKAHTAELFYRLPIARGKSIEPHLRWYHQTESDIHRYYLVAGQPVPTYASADSRLAQFSALTAGLSYSFPVDDVTRLSLSAEYYAQFGKRGPPDAIGILRNYDLFPRLRALMFRVGLSHDL